MEKVKERTGIYHEQQQGALCGQHAVNNLLQGPMFSADTLADIARELDAEEKSVLTHSSHHSENMDDTGFFNIQVLQRALKVFDIELVPLSSQEPIAEQARDNPSSIQAYICNLGLHWFALRRFAGQYFNLNSVYYVPELIPSQSLSVNFNYIQENGYSVFIVHGHLDDCLADRKLKTNPIGLSEYRLLTKDLPKLIMDGEVLEGSRGVNKKGDLVVQVPRDVFNELEKNPNNQRLRQMIMEQVPKDLLEEEIPEHTNCSNPHHHHQRRRRQIIVACMPEEGADGQLMGRCSCPSCIKNSHRQLLSDPFDEQLFDEENIDELSGSFPRSQMITRRMAQALMSEPDPNDPSRSSQQRNVSSTVLIMTRTPRISSASINNQNIQQMNRPNLRIENEEEILMKHALARSLLSESIREKERALSLFRKKTDEFDQEMLDIAIAASLYTNDAETQQIEQAPKIIPVTNVDSSPTPTMNSKPEIIKMPSELTASPPTNVHSLSPNVSSSAPPNTPSTPLVNAPLPPLTNTSLPPTTNTSLPPSTLTSSSSPVATNSPPPTTTNLPPPTNTTLPPSTPTNSSPPVATNSPPPTTTTTTTTNSPPPPRTAKSSAPTLPRSDSTEPPTIEELRQRRLRGLGNRDRSIISQQSNFDD